jgi:hypothetical protein
MDYENTMLSRSGRTDPAGKLSSRIDVPMPERLESQIIAIATILGITKAEWIRQTCDKELNGCFPMLQSIGKKSGMFNVNKVRSSGDDE